MRWSEFLTGYSAFFCIYDEKDTFADLGKSTHDERFVLKWNNSPPFAQNPHTSIFRFTQKTIKNEQTTTNPNVTFFVMSRKRSNPCRSFQRKKT